MFHNKIYGASKTEKCPFCGKPALWVNKQGIPVCHDHKDRTVDFRCACGEHLEPKKSKWGAFFVCRNCGAVSMQKALEMNADIGHASGQEKDRIPAADNIRPDGYKNFHYREGDTPAQKTDKWTMDKTGRHDYLQHNKGKERNIKKEVTVRSDDPLYFS